MWRLEADLAEIPGFESPKIALEQYATSPHLAAQCMNAALNLGDIDGSILDLGCGTGRLGYACSWLGADYVLGVDIDAEPLKVASEYLDVLQADVVDLDIHKFDTCVTNPPFGTRNKGVDVAFVKTALRHARRAVYSLHKTATREYMLKKDWGVPVKVIAELRFDLPRNYAFHTKATTDIQVDLLRFDLS